MVMMMMMHVHVCVCVCVCVQKCVHVRAHVCARAELMCGSTRASCHLSMLVGVVRVDLHKAHPLRLPRGRGRHLGCVIECVIECAQLSVCD